MNEKQSKNKINPYTEAEEAVLVFWKKAGIFEKSVAKEAPRGNYVFYDGPPFGTGEPHYGHILSSVSKDVVPRYQTMRGYRVERRWGWDCHGLPIENIIEKQLGISGKKQIEEIGVKKFNETCRSQVLAYTDAWEKMVDRIGRWVEFKDSYKTMDPSFMESVWWAFQELYNKDLVYEGKKVLLYCARCETPISNFEVAMDNSYKEIDDESIYVKFKVIPGQKIGDYGVVDNTYFLAWTTTPWTLPSNVALALGAKIDYVLIEREGEKYILAYERVENLFPDQNYQIIQKFSGSNLINVSYEPLFNLSAENLENKKVYYTLNADFVSTEDGTGIVHIAPAHGDDDYKAGITNNLPNVALLDEKGHFKDEPKFLAGVYFRKANNLIIENLKESLTLLKSEKTKHSYPHCHRCENPLFYNAIPAWFIDIQALKPRILELNQKINWYPGHLKDGRFAKGIEQAPDWNISRNRYFATPIPVWKCSQCDCREIIGSINELKEKSGTTNISDIHSHHIDNLIWKCQKCDGEMRRISEVFDCWVESGSMPFAQMHYPFENKEKFHGDFPSQFISEYISQTRAWFYVMHVLSTALFDEHSFDNVITTGVILNEKGEKMSKSKKNYPDPYEVINEYGADALRFYLMSSTVMHSDNLLFNKEELKDLFRKNIIILWNVLKFYEMFSVNAAVSENNKESENTLDKWILVCLQNLINEVTDQMEAYDLPRAARPIEEFIDDLSTWYVRRSRDRFKGDDEKDKQAALKTLKFTLKNLAQVMAPFMPFIAEYVWQKVSRNNFKNENKSVHLENWPEVRILNTEEKNILIHMGSARLATEAALAAREKAGIKIRQPLGKLKIKNCVLSSEYEAIIQNEINVKEIVWEHGAGKIEAVLDTVITEELKLEGLKREFVRAVNALRKNAGLSLGDKIVLHYKTDSIVWRAVMENFKNNIQNATLSDNLMEQENLAQQNLSFLETEDGKIKFGFQNIF